MRFDRRWGKVVAVGIVLATAMTGCGSDDKNAGSDNGDEGAGSGDTPSMTPTPSGLAGEWTASPGQADKVQQALTAKGFECTRNADPAADLRVCSKSMETGKDTDLGGKQMTQGILRFLSDSQGTVVLASMGEAGQSENLETAMTQALLPSADAAVYLADGTDLSWGTVSDGRNGLKILTVKGWPSDKIFTPAFQPLQTTKEKALPALQAAKLKCKFAKTDEWGSPRNGLSCFDPSFRMKDDDGSMEGGAAELVLVDDGAGISSVKLETRHGKEPALNTAGVKKLLPALTTVDPSLQEVSTWIGQHLDNVPHSAYVGQWRVDTTVVRSGGIAGWPYVSVSLSTDQPNLGMEGLPTPTPGMTDTPTDGSSETPSETPSN